MIVNLKKYIAIKIAATNQRGYRLRLIFMKVQKSKRFIQTLSIAIATVIGISICEMSVARPRGGAGSFQRRNNVAPRNYEVVKV